MDSTIYGIANLVISSVILGLMLSGHDSPKAPNSKAKKLFGGSEPPRKPVAITDEMALDREMEARENSV